MSNGEYGKEIASKLEADPSFYTGALAEKTGDHNLDMLKGAKLLEIVDALEQGN